MITATAKLKSISPYSQSKYHNTPKLDKELPHDYTERTWRHFMHVTPEGEVFIPPMAPKNALSEAAKYLNKSIPGKGKSTYTKHFEAGVLVDPEPIRLGIKSDEVQGEKLFLPADGRRGSGKRVEKIYPLIPSWEATVVFMVVDPMITEDVFREVLSEAGKFIGIGRFRPRNNGYYGRFVVVSMKWEGTK